MEQQSVKKKKVTQRKRNKIPTDIKVILSNKTSNKNIPTGIKEEKVNQKEEKFDNDYLYEDLRDLVNEAYKRWYMQKFYLLGRTRVQQLATIARQDGENPAKLFSYLLNKPV